jgi:hypothetical protein
MDCDLLWDMMSSSVVRIFQHSRGTYCFSFQVRRQSGEGKKLIQETGAQEAHQWEWSKLKTLYDIEKGWVCV